MKPSILVLAAAWLVALHPGVALAFDSGAVLSSIAAARPKPATTGPAGTAASPIPPEARTADQAERLAKEEEAAFRLLSTCEGRFGTLRRNLERQVSRAEWISTAGGLMGVLGAVATCPHCAALAAGLAGLANPLQQTYRANADTPADTQDLMNKLSAKIDQELTAYRQLPPAVPGDAEFEARLRSRLDALFVVAASCAFYSSSLGNASGTEPAPAAKP